jgi:hypothetical protein
MKLLKKSISKKTQGKKSKTIMINLINLLPEI